MRAVQRTLHRERACARADTIEAATVNTDACEAPETQDGAACSSTSARSPEHLPSSNSQGATFLAPFMPCISEAREICSKQNAYVLLTDSISVYHLHVI